jgi:hypothetical protein
MVTMVTANILEMVNIAEAPTHCGDGFSDWLIIYCFTPRSRIFH